LSDRKEWLKPAAEVVTVLENLLSTAPNRLLTDAFRNPRQTGATMQMSCEMHLERWNWERAEEESGQ
jgi:hypothetical protein